MTHSKIRASLNDYVDRTLPGRTRSEVSAHLATCSSCAEEVRELEAMVTLLRRMPEVEPPPLLASVVMARVRDGEAEPWSWRRSLQQLLQPTLRVTATAAVAGLAVFAVARGPALTPSGAPAESAPSVGIATNLPAAALPASPTEPAPPLPVLPRPESQLAANDTALPGAVAGRATGMRPAFETQMLRRQRALLRNGHREEVARITRGAGHPHSAVLANHFDDHVDPFQLTALAR